MELLYKEITDLILKSFFNVYNTLGFGFLEKVYENAMMIELQSFNLDCTKQKPIEVFYKQKKVGDYFADIIVENKVIVELKAVEFLIPEHEAQLINYLKATRIEVGLLLNFGKTAQFKRKVFQNELKISANQFNP
ncbi:MAG: GxxExxY protein [Ignavibacteria bacterium]|nr:GxxExxY protein [Ignavibacteria bacterium]